MWKPGFERSLNAIFEGFGNKIVHTWDNVQFQLEKISEQSVRIELNIDEIYVSEYSFGELYDVLNPSLNLLYLFQDIIDELSPEGSIKMAKYFMENTMEYLGKILINNKKEMERIKTNSAIGYSFVGNDGIQYVQLSLF